MIERAVVFGAGGAVGSATVRALTAQGARVWAVGRTRAPLEALGAGIEIVVGDAADPGVVGRVLDAATPDLVVVAVGVRPKLAHTDEQTWESFSAVWNGDVQASFHIAQHTLRRPLRAGSSVVIVSSGAALGGSPLSGGYAGAKRMQMFLAGYLQKRADALKLGVRYVALVPKQLLAGTEIGVEASTAYAAEAGLSVEAFMKRFEVPMGADGVAGAILRIGAGDAPAGAILAISGAKGLEAL